MGMATTDFRYEAVGNKVVLGFGGAEAVEKAAALQIKVRRIPRRPCAGSSGSTPVRAIQRRHYEGLRPPDGVGLSGSTRSAGCNEAAWQVENQYKGAWNPVEGFPVGALKIEEQYSCKDAVIGTNSPNKISATVTPPAKPTSAPYSPIEIEEPTANPTELVTRAPTAEPTAEPTREPTELMTAFPTQVRSRAG
jgi:hypothetical protein